MTFSTWSASKGSTNRHTSTWSSRTDRQHMRFSVILKDFVNQRARIVNTPSKRVSFPTQRLYHVVTLSRGSRFCQWCPNFTHIAHVGGVRIFGWTDRVLPLRMSIRNNFVCIGICSALALEWSNFLRWSMLSFIVKLWRMRLFYWDPFSAVERSWQSFRVVIPQRSEPRVLTSKSENECLVYALQTLCVIDPSLKDDVTVWDLTSRIAQCCGECATLSVSCLSRNLINEGVLRDISHDEWREEGHIVTQLALSLE